MAIRKKQNISGTDSRQRMRAALRLARRGLGRTSPNPMVGAVLTKAGKVIARGWHRRAGCPHAEIEAIRDAEKRGADVRGATLHVTLEPCCTHGRTPPCTDAIIAAGIKRVVAGAIDPNPKHRGKAFRILKRAGIAVTSDVLGDECARLNAAFNHWIVHRTPFVTVKAAMTVDGKIATARGESKWITGAAARAHGMTLRFAADAILVGVNTILADDPGLTFRNEKTAGEGKREPKHLRRIILDSEARTPLNAKVISDSSAALTTIVVSQRAPQKRIAALAKRVQVVLAPLAGPKIKNHNSGIDLRWLMKRLGNENVTSLLVEGGGEVNASFLFGGFAQRIVFFYAPKILGGRDSRKAVAGGGACNLQEALKLKDVTWRRLGPDLVLTASVASNL